MADELRTYVVSFARLATEGIFQGLDLTDALHESWEPGATVTRYRRRWYVERIASEDDRFLFGRIGFIAEREVANVFFDPKLQIFIRHTEPVGVVVPLMIDKTSGLVAYQLRPGVVKPQSFEGALKALLNGTSRTYSWHVDSLTVAADFSAWRGSIERVTQFQFKLERPNPHYWDNDAIEEAIEGVHLEWLRLAGAAEAGDSVDPEADLFRQALDHVMRDYGRGVVTGVEADGTESIWVKTRGEVGSVVSKRRILGVGDDEVPEAVLREAHQQAPANMGSADLSDLEDGSIDE